MPWRHFLFFHMEGLYTMHSINDLTHSLLQCKEQSSVPVRKALLSHSLYCLCTSHSRRLLTDGLNYMPYTEWYSSPKCLSIQSAAHECIFSLLEAVENIRNACGNSQMRIYCNKSSGILGTQVCSLVFTWHASLTGYLWLSNDRLSLSWTRAESS